jgi:2-polyprenyl-6-methoxyphenol hydroxylase-like FAD-dependent oxidoreductase
MRELLADIAIIGGGTGGCAAALAAARNGLRVVMTEETDWIGGQLTQQAVPPDEHPWIEQSGCTRSYREYRNRVREFYRRNYSLTPAARNTVYFNPGNGSVSRLCHEPRVALAVLNEMLMPYLSDGRITLLLHHEAVEAEVEGDVVRSVTVRSRLTGDETILIAPYILDATELGDLLPMTGTEFVTGFESQLDTGETRAPVEAQPDNHQAFTCCFATALR